MKLIMFSVACIESVIIIISNILHAFACTICVRFNNLYSILDKEYEDIAKLYVKVNVNSKRYKLNNHNTA